MKAAIIGSGFSSLACASVLAQNGYQVTVFEKHGQPGGRARVLEEGGFKFDMGPSWYWMPDIFESFFNRFEKSTEDYYQLQRLSPSYRVFFKNHPFLDVSAELEKLYDQFESIEPGSKQVLKSVLKEAQYKYEVGMKEFVYKESLSFTEFISTKIIAASFKLDLLKSVKSYFGSRFKEERLIQILEFPVLFLGAMPEDTPALYTMMNYADMVLGTWYPKGGMHQVVRAMVDLATELGVNFHLNQNVEEIKVENNKATGLVANGSFHAFDLVISGADYNHTDRVLLKNHSNYSSSYWDKRTFAPSCLLYYIGVSKKIKNLLHHNLCFDTDFQPHAKTIYKSKSWPDAPQFYVSCASKTDPTVAPEGKENIMLLIPVASGLEDTQEIRDHYFDLILNRLEILTGEEIKDHIEYKRDYAIADFKKDYNAYKGNAYGLANTLQQTAFLKPKIVHKKIKNVFFTGQLTTPGPGVPPALISGQVVADYIIKTFHSQLETASI